MMRRILVLGVLLLGSASASLMAELERQHGAHVHGEASGTMALDGSQLQLELEIPGVNLVGFEHPPRTDEQAQRLAATLARLNDGAWLQTDPRGECRIERINAQGRGFNTGQAQTSESHRHDEEGRRSDRHHHAHDQDHDHKHEHEHEHEHEQSHGHDHHDRHDHHRSRHRNRHDHSDGHSHQHDNHGHDHDQVHDHAEFHVVATLSCTRPERLRWLDLGLFEDFPGNERITMDVLTESLATRARLAPGRERISLVNP